MMEKNSYRYLASHYDILSSDTDYERWSDFIEGIFAKNEIAKGSIILDAGCGTGSMTLCLAKKGYDMIGVDISFEMLSLARKKAEEQGVSPLFLCQDMSDIELYGTVKGAVSCLDSVNYLTDISKLDRFFAMMQRYIEFGGVLIFDVNTKAKFEQVYADNAYILEEDGVLCAWQNHYSKSSRLCSFYLSIFEEEADGRYTRYDEIQKERYFPTSTISRLLQKNGFEILHVVSDFDMTPASEKDMRHYYICKKAKDIR